MVSSDPPADSPVDAVSGLERNILHDAQIDVAVPRIDAPETFGDFAPMRAQVIVLSDEGFERGGLLHGGHGRGWSKQDFRGIGRICRDVDQVIQEKPAERIPMFGGAGMVAICS